MDEQKVSKHYYIYLLGEALIAIAAIMMFQRGILVWQKPAGLNILLFALILQVIWHVIIMFEGYRTGNQKAYANLYPLSVPSMFMLFITWFNTL